MPSKLQLYSQMANDAARQVAGSYRSWTGFLETAARLYKYPFNEQLMIYAQRPDAVACAEYGFWNDSMRRYVRRGSKGIALIDTSGDNPRLRYVFDVSDTGGRFGAGTTGRNMPTRYLRPWNVPTTFPVKTALRRSLNKSLPDLQVSIGMPMQGTSSTSLMIRFSKSMMISTSERHFGTPQRSVSPTPSCLAVSWNWETILNMRTF